MPKFLNPTILWCFALSLFAGLSGTSLVFAFSKVPRLNSEIEDLRAMSDQVTPLEEEKNELEEKNEELNDELNRKRDELEKEESKSLRLEKESQRTREQLENKEGVITKLQKEQADSTAKLKKRLNDLEEALNEAKRALEDARKKVDKEKLIREEVLNGDIADLLLHKRKLEERREKAVENRRGTIEMNEIESDLADCEMHLDSKRKKLESLKSPPTTQKSTDIPKSAKPKTEKADEEEKTVTPGAPSAPEGP
ncbi:MAG: hypothetical protein CMJ34_01880 [Phycisphaerae bacterium]|nr:hypothetical protein [Phycisphaerae bacterium]